MAPQRSDNSRPIPMPSTRFGRSRIRNAADLALVDWPSVVLHEAKNVADWVRFLHQHHATSMLSPLLYAIMEGLPPIGATRPNPSWLAFAETELLCLLMDIVCEPDMFNDDTLKVCPLFVLHVEQNLIFCRVRPTEQWSYLSFIGVWLQRLT